MVFYGSSLINYFSYLNEATVTVCVVFVNNVLRFNPLSNVTLDVTLEKRKRGQFLLGHSFPHLVADLAQQGSGGRPESTKRQRVSAPKPGSRGR